jgi:pimeloyl-ACP methyl ester carboxylesterase
MKIAAHAIERAVVRVAGAPSVPSRVDGKHAPRRRESCGNVGPEAHAEDVCAVLEALGREPAVVVGQSLGGRTAVLAAARCPNLVRAVVVLEATMDAGDEALDRDVEDFRARLLAWPVPFATEADACAFFADRYGSEAAARAWTAGLMRVAEGLTVRFDPDVMAETLREAFGISLASEWEALKCPKSMWSAADLGGSIHDIHIERPDDVAAVVLETANGGR